MKKILFTILNNLDYDGEYCLFYTFKDYFETHGCIDSGYYDEYEGLENILESYDIYHMQDGTLEIPERYTFKDVLKIINENCPNMEFSNDLTDFIIDTFKYDLEEYGWTQKEIIDWEKEKRDFLK